MAAPQAPQGLAVSGCQHASINGMIRGNFLLSGANHGRPTYAKTETVNGVSVMIYFWDDRDGPNFGGWWFGPQVGGNEVWAYHPEKSTPSPPLTGWRVPHNGGPDPTLLITPQRAPARPPPP
eukprot:CAMPEP_0179334184 /NCGR_PEP_ID=MMETSP0797-20121207/65798_1 /TAXON_ID=47934 /ORGANISM="Dinophysis acuminata, Strain DAEP01" /LENGTH=121 /DNA_ID=CAMNT_0021047435 /DNA_START=90 /DNA_END=451 /DNA_ORIENTATION=-